MSTNKPRIGPVILEIAHKNYDKILSYFNLQGFNFEIFNLLKEDLKKVSYYRNYKYFWNVTIVAFQT